MTTPENLPPEEWTTLKESLFLIAAAVMAASRSGMVGRLREMSALVGDLSPNKVADEYRFNELVMGLVREAAEPQEPEEQHQGTPDKTLAAALDACQKVAAILAARVPPGEGEQFKRWLMSVAGKVAAASGSGWFGGGEKVGPQEAEVLQQLATALGL